MSNSNPKRAIHNIRTQVDDFGRKKYKLQQVVNEEEEEQPQQTKNISIIDTGRHKSMLIGREQSLNIDKYKGKLQTNKKKKVTEVFYCDVCSQGFKCDMAYITHLNSPAHNRKLGMNMKVKAVTLDSVSSKIKAMIEKKNNKGEENELENKMLQTIQGDQNQKRTQQKKLNSKQNRQEQNQEQNNEDQQEHLNDQLKEEQKAIKKQQVQHAQQQEQQQDDDQQAQLQMMRQMGLPTSFGSKKRKQ